MPDDVAKEFMDFVDRCNKGEIDRIQIKKVIKIPSGIVNQSHFLYDPKSCTCGVTTKQDADDDVREDQPDSPESRLRVAISDVFEDIGSQVVDAVGKRKDNGIRVKLAARDVSRILALLEGLEQSLADSLKEPLTDMIGAGGSAGLDKINIDTGFDVTNPEVVSFINRQTTLLAGEISQLTRQKVESVLRDGITSGATPTDIANAIEDTGSFSPARAEAIARTESANAFVEGQKESWRQSNVVRGVKWLLAPNACEFCRATAAKFNNVVQPLDKPFYSLGDTVTGTEGGKLNVNFRNITGPPLHPNDRCDLVPVLETP